MTILNNPNQGIDETKIINLESNNLYQIKIRISNTNSQLFNFDMEKVEWAKCIEAAQEFNA